MIYAKLSTAITLTFGPILDIDGAEYTGAVVGDVKICKNNGTPGALNGSATLTHKEVGMYELVLTASDISAVGQATVQLSKTTYVAAPRDITVYPAAVYDALIAGTGTLKATDGSGDALATSAQAVAAAAVQNLILTRIGTLAGEIVGDTDPTADPRTLLGQAQALARANWLVDYCDQPRVTNTHYGVGGNDGFDGSTHALRKLTLPTTIPANTEARILAGNTYTLPAGIVLSNANSTLKAYWAAGSESATIPVLTANGGTFTCVQASGDGSFVENIWGTNTGGIGADHHYTFKLTPTTGAICAMRGCIGTDAGGHVIGQLTGAASGGIVALANCSAGGAGTNNSNCFNFFNADGGQVVYMKDPVILYGPRTTQTGNCGVLIHTGGGAAKFGRVILIGLKCLSSAKPPDSLISYADHPTAGVTSPATSKFWEIGTRLYPQTAGSTRWCNPGIARPYGVQVNCRYELRPQGADQHLSCNSGDALGCSYKFDLGEMSGNFSVHNNAASGAQTPTFDHCRFAVENVLLNQGFSFSTTAAGIAGGVMTNTITTATGDVAFVAPIAQDVTVDNNAWFGFPQTYQSDPDDMIRADTNVIYLARNPEIDEDPSPGTETYQSSAVSRDGIELETDIDGNFRNVSTPNVGPVDRSSNLTTIAAKLLGVSAQAVTIQYTADDVEEKVDDIQGVGFDSGHTLVQLGANLGTVGTSVFSISTRVPAALIGGRMDSNVQATAATLTFNLTGNVTGNLSGTVGSVTGSVGSIVGMTTTDIATALLDLANGIETNLTVRECLRLMGAVTLGKVTGGGTGTEVFRNAVADTKARVTATVDANGNRSAITSDKT